MDRDEMMMAARLAVQWLGGIAVGYGIGDAAAWASAAGLVALVAGYWMSRTATARLRTRALSGEAALGMAREMAGRR